MTTLIKITFQSTSGEEVNGLAALHRDGTVVLPARMLQFVEAATAAGEGYALTGHRSGYLLPLIHRLGASYTLGEGHAASEAWSKRLADAFLKPSKDQLLAYARYCHTMSAACIVGLAGYVAGRPGWSTTSVVNAACLLVLGAVLFAVGAIYSKGEK
ncbi:MAG TPA: hypothetical protein VM659_13965 [Dongiaceae bacterium]|nr:hypothetical protein [Dongiaceae bacterium]